MRTLNHRSVVTHCVTRLFVPCVTIFVASFMTFWMTGCGAGDGPRKITQTRETTVADGAAVIDASSADRFGRGPFTAGHPETAAHPDDGHEGPELIWKNPPGWIELPPTDIRIANLRPAGNPDADCYLSVVGGGLTANVNRWRKQFGQPELDARSIADLPKQELLGMPATIVELEGEFTAMSAGPMAAATKSEPRPGFKLVGLIAARDDQLLFVKMTGPKQVIDAEMPQFQAFVQSLQVQPMGGAGERTPAADPGAAAAAAGGGGFHDAPMKWVAPVGWIEGEKKTSRIVTLRPNGSAETECAVSMLVGSGGGVRPNLDRWCVQQMGRAKLSDLEFNGLEKVQVLGQECSLLEIDGKFEDSMNNRSVPDARLLGLVCPLPDSAVFIKMTGPAGDVAACRDAFLDFCRSLTR